MRDINKIYSAINGMELWFPETSVFKYFDETGTRFFDSMKLKVTCPRYFNDPFEFSVSFAHKKLKQMINQSFQNPFGKMRQKAISLNGNDKINFNLLSKQTYKELFRFYNKLCKDFPNEILKYTGVACFSMDGNNHLMWSHYARNHRGFVVEFDSTKIPLSASDFWLKVRYLKNKPELPINYNGLQDYSGDRMIEIANTKSKDWEYEKEARLITEIVRDVNNFKEIPIRAIKSIYLGCRASSEIELKILDFRLANYSENNIRIFRMKTSKTEYMLRPVELHGLGSYGQDV